MIRAMDDDLTTSDARNRIAKGKQSASADRNLPGHISIHSGTELTLSVWAWHIKVIRKLNDTGGTRITFHGPWYLDTSATVSDVTAAMGAAQALYNATKADDKWRRDT